MKKLLPVLLALLAVVTLFAACERGKNTEEETDPNAVLTDSDVPLDVGAELIAEETHQPAEIVDEQNEVQPITDGAIFSEVSMP